MLRWLKHLKDLAAFQALSREEKGIVFYSETNSYRKYLCPLIEEILRTTNLPVCYVSSEPVDEKIKEMSPALKTFEIGEGFVRNSFFENLDARVLVMSMPDLDTFQVKRSKHKVHYVYVQHSMVSKHMVYRKGAFDAFDTIMCSGPYQIEEIRALEKAYDLPPKNLLEHGYVALEAFLKVADSKVRTAERPHVLVAPSWGPNALIEVCGEALVEPLIAAGFKVTLRPHPQTLKFSKALVDKLLKKHSKHPHFVFSGNTTMQQDFFDSDIMISDWSGAALEYAFGLEKPVVFIDVPRKVNNPEYEKINMTPFEDYIREEIGEVVSPNDLDSLPHKIQTLLNGNTIVHSIKDLRDKYIFNSKNSAEVGAKMIVSIYEQNA